MMKYIFMLVGHAMFLLLIFFLVKDVIHAHEPTKTQAFFVILFIMTYVVATVRYFFPRRNAEWEPV